MPDALTLDRMAELLATLDVAFPKGHSQDTGALLHLYFEQLQRFSGEAVHHAVSLAIAEDEWFPKVARLRTLATAWARENEWKPAAVEARDETWDRCACGGAMRYVDWWRPRTDARHRLLVNRAAMVFYLEPLERLVCDRCGGNTLSPTPGSEPPSLPLADMPDWLRRREWTEFDPDGDQHSTPIAKTA